jgi:hypothetical protein
VAPSGSAPAQSATPPTATGTGRSSG